jgi:hypothetical protein
MIKKTERRGQNPYLAQVCGHALLQVWLTCTRCNKKQGLTSSSARYRIRHCLAAPCIAGQLLDESLTANARGRLFCWYPLAHWNKFKSWQHNLYMLHIFQPTRQGCRSTRNLSWFSLLQSWPVNLPLPKAWAMAVAYKWAEGRALVGYYTAIVVQLFGLLKNEMHQRSSETGHAEGKHTAQSAE